MIRRVMHAFSDRAFAARPEFTFDARGPQAINAQPAGSDDDAFPTVA